MASHDAVSDMAVAYQRHRVSIDEFHKMVAADVFDPDARIELIDGAIVEHVSPIGPPHAFTTTRLTTLLVERLGRRVEVRTQSPVTLSRDSEPQPDILVARPSNAYWERHPEAAETLLVIEVADSSVSSDRRRKIPLYAQAGVPEVWLVDLVRSLVYVYRDPLDGEYANVTVAHRGKAIAPQTFPDDGLAVNDFLPPE